MTCFFIGGINRSGTTLLQSILCSDSETNPLIHEASYLRKIIEAYETGLYKFEEHGKYYFSSVDEMREFTASWAKQFLDKVYKRYPGSRHLVLKHPPMTSKFPLLMELLDAVNIDTKFFIIVRDPRDVAASLVKIGEQLRAQNDPEGNSLPRNMQILANYYMSTYMPALSHKNPKYQQRLTIIKYEDLVTQPELSYEKIRKASGLALDGLNTKGDWANDELDYKQLKQSENAWLSNLWGKKITNSRIGSYRQILTANEIKQMESACAGPLKSFGYI